MRPIDQNKKHLLLSVACAVITIIAVCALVVTASYIEMPSVARVVLILFTAVIAGVGIWVAMLLELEAGSFECPHCKTLFVPTIREYLKGYHTATKRRLKCHACGKTGMCKYRIQK